VCVVVGMGVCVAVGVGVDVCACVRSLPLCFMTTLHYII